MMPCMMQSIYYFVIYLKYRWSFFASFFLCQTHNKQWFYIYYYKIRQQPILVLSFSIITIETMYLVIILYLEFFSSSHRNQVCSRYKIRFVYRKRRNEKERNKCIGIEMERERERERYVRQNNSPKPRYCKYTRHFHLIGKTESG